MQLWMSKDCRENTGARRKAEGDTDTVLSRRAEIPKPIVRDTYFGYIDLSMEIFMISLDNAMTACHIFCGAN